MGAASDDYDGFRANHPGDRLPLLLPVTRVVQILPVATPTPPVGGAVEIGGSGWPLRVTPDFMGNLMFGAAGLWQELGRSVLSDSVDPTSDHLIGMMPGVNLHVDFGGDTSNPLYGIPINTVAGTQPRIPITIGSYASESDNVLIPMPAVPSIENWLSLAKPTQADAEDGADHHLLIAVRDEATGGIAELIEIYQPWYDGVWHCAQVSRWDMVSGAPRPDGWTSTDAAGLPRLPLMVRYDECRHPLGIRHPLAITFNVGAIRNRYIWPARHAALSGNSDDGIPFGARLRLKDSWYQANKNSFTSDARAIVEAMRVYGVINADIGGMLFLLGISDSRFSTNNLLTLQTIPNTAFEVLTMTPAFRPTGPTSLSVGQTGTYSLNLVPANDPNTTHGFYLGATLGGVVQNNVVQPDHLLAGQQTFTFTPVSPGTYQITVDQAGEYKLPWKVPPLEYQVIVT